MLLKTPQSKISLIILTFKKIFPWENSIVLGIIQKREWSTLQRWSCQIIFISSFPLAPPQETVLLSKPKFLKENDLENIPWVLGLEHSDNMVEKRYVFI